MTYHHLNRQKIRLSLVNPRPMVREMLEFVNFSKLVRIYDSLDDVMALGIVNKSDARSLGDALALINRIRLNHQAEQMSTEEQARFLLEASPDDPELRAEVGRLLESN